MEKGLKKTSVIIRDGEKAYGYLVSAKEAKSYDRYTNKEAFAHLESGDLKSTTIREWNFSTEGEESNEKLLKLFCLDPGYNKPKPSYWNCVIDTSRKNTGKYPYWYITDENTCKVEIKEMITFEEL